MARDLHSTRGEFVARRPRAQRRRMFVVILVSLALAAAIGGAVYLVWFSNVFTVTGISVEGARLTDSDEVLRTLANKLDTRPLLPRLFKRENILYWPHSLEMHGEELNEPAIDSVTLHTDLARKIVSIVVHEREFAGVWCADRCVGFDPQGIAYFDTPDLEGSLLLNIQDASTTAPALGTRVLPGAQFDHMMRTVDAVRRAGIAITRVTVRDADLREWAIYPVRGGPLLLSFDFVPNELDKVLKNIVEHADWNALQYVDLRVENRVYYK